MNRPIAIGDMIVLNNKSQCNIGSIVLIKSEWHKSTGWRNFETPIMIMTKQGTRHLSLDDIKTIRKPRKGGAEARAIVAMLARNVHKKAIHLHRALKPDATYREIYMMLRNTDASRYLKAKSMLGETK